MPHTRFRLAVPHAAVVVIDPQVDFLSPRGAAWAVVGESVERNHTVQNIERLLQAATRAGMVVAVSPHFYYPTDHRWGFGGPLEALMERVGGSPQPAALTADTPAAGEDVMPQYKKYLLEGKTIAPAHKRYGPDGGLSWQLHRRGIAQAVLAGMSANLCVESHLRALIEQGFEVAVVHDATAGARMGEGDGYGAALVNFRYLADALWSTDETVIQM